jgi:hypothetical protein
MIWLSIALILVSITSLAIMLKLKSIRKGYKLLREAYHRQQNTLIHISRQLTEARGELADTRENHPTNPNEMERVFQRARERMQHMVAGITPSVGGPFPEYTLSRSQVTMEPTPEQEAQIERLEAELEAMITSPGSSSKDPEEEQEAPNFNRFEELE